MTPMLIQVISATVNGIIEFGKLKCLMTVINVKSQQIMRYNAATIRLPDWTLNLCRSGHCEN